MIGRHWKAEPYVRGYRRFPTYHVMVSNQRAVTLQMFFRMLDSPLLSLYFYKIPAPITFGPIGLAKMKGRTGRRGLLMLCKKPQIIR